MSGDFKDFANAGSPLDSSFEPQGHGIANPHDAAAYVTDLHDPNNENKDLLTRGREDPLLSTFPGRHVNATVAGEAEITPLSGKGPIMPNGTDRSIVIFYLRKPIKKIYVRIQNPGDKLQITDRPATQADTVRWPKQWYGFRYSEDIVKNSTPVFQLFAPQPAATPNVPDRSIEDQRQCPGAILVTLR